MVITSFRLLIASTLAEAAGAVARRWGRRATRGWARTVLTVSTCAGVPFDGTGLIVIASVRIAPGNGTMIALTAGQAMIAVTVPVPFHRPSANARFSAADPDRAR